MTTAFACVPPVRKCTAASGAPQASLIFLRALSENSSAP